MHRAKPKTKAPLGIMEKRIPENPRYKNVTSKIDSGTTVNKIRLISHKEFLKRRDETFCRVTCNCLNDLFNEYEDTGSGDGTGNGQPEMVAKMVKQPNGEFVMERVPCEDNQASTGAACNSSRSSTSSGPRVVSYDAEEKEEYDVPYLILDTRTPQEFAVNRIHRAINFPTSYLCRDIALPEMYKFKNQENKLIIIYDQDDKTIAQTAHVLVQRGFDNVYVLTGGLIEYAEMYPDHIEGTLPPRKPVDPKQKKSVPQKEVYKSANALTCSSSNLSARSERSVATRKKDAGSEVSSVMSSLSVAESVISKATARKARVQASNFR